MSFHHLVICAALVGFAPAALPIIPDTAQAAQTVKKKKKVVQNQAEPRVKKNFFRSPGVTAASSCPISARTLVAILGPA